MSALREMLRNDTAVLLLVCGKGGAACRTAFPASLEHTFFDLNSIQTGKNPRWVLLSSFLTV
jgi:hypothetical protein